LRAEEVESLVTPNSIVQKSWKVPSSLFWGIYPPRNKHLEANHEVVSSDKQYTVKGVSFAQADKRRSGY